MSFLYEENTNKVIKWVGGFFAIVLIIGMVILYSPGLLSALSGIGAPSRSTQSAPVS